MNEVQLLRAQLAAEREHLREVAALCAARRREDNISYDFIISCTEYLLFRLSKEHARGVALQNLQGVAPENLRRALIPVTAAIGELRAQSTARNVATDARQRLELLDRCAALADQLIESRRALEALAESRYTVEDWRRVACIDADSILEERKLRAEVLRHGTGA